MDKSGLKVMEKVKQIMKDEVGSFDKEAVQQNLAPRAVLEKISPLSKT